MDRLVRDYLVTGGFAKTLAVLDRGGASQGGSKARPTTSGSRSRTGSQASTTVAEELFVPAAAASLDARSSIRAAILDGDLGRARDLIDAGSAEGLFPEDVVASPGVVSDLLTV